MHLVCIQDDMSNGADGEFVVESAANCQVAGEQYHTVQNCESPAVLFADYAENHRRGSGFIESTEGVSSRLYP